MKILILTSYNIGDMTSGQGLILTHFVSTLQGVADIEICLGRFRCLPPALNSSSPGKYDACMNELFNVEGKPISKITMLRCIAGFINVKSEKEFLHKVQQKSSEFDLAIWFGSAYDPVSVKLPLYCKCPIVFHLNDSISLYQQRLKSKRFVKLRVLTAEHHEKRILSAGYAKIIYVAREDYQVGLKLCRREGNDSLAFLPNGVDDKFFCPSTNKITKNKVKLLFAGVMCYQPNIDAAMYLIQKIMPNIEEDIEMRIAGRDPALEISNAAQKDSRIVVTGTVDDMAIEYQEADIFIAPMISGAGIQNKILQALACGLPVITTSICADAFEEIPAGCLVANSIGEMIESIKSLLHDKKTRYELGQMGKKFIEKNWSWQHRTGTLLNLMSEVVNRQ